MRPRDTGIGEGGRKVLVGVVVKAVGLKGELKIRPLTDNPERYAPGGRIWLETPDGKTAAFTVEAAREQKDCLVVSLEGIASVEEAEEFRGREVFVPESEVPPLPKGEFYHYQVLGLPVFTAKGRLLGKVAEIIPAGEKDVYVVKGGGKEYLIPVTDDAVDSMDLQEGIKLRPLKGYIPE